MRLMSFALTTEQVRRQEKTVTRRLGWKNLTPGTLIQPVVKGQGLKKGETVQWIGGPIRIVSVRREPLRLLLNGDDYAWAEVAREGFPANGDSPKRWPSEFVKFFSDSHGCTADDDGAIGMLGQDEYDLDLIDDPYRTCEVCDITYHEEYGESCRTCDIWICRNCWPEHLSDECQC